MSITLQSIYVVFWMLGTDWLWTFYIRRSAEGRALASGFFSLLIMAVGGTVAINYVHNRWLLIPAALGAGVGTASSVWWDHRRKQADKK